MTPPPFLPFSRGLPKTIANLKLFTIDVFVFLFPIVVFSSVRLSTVSMTYVIHTIVSTDTIAFTDTSSSQPLHPHRLFVFTDTQSPSHTPTLDLIADMPFGTGPFGTQRPLGTEPFDTDWMPFGTNMTTVRQRFGIHPAIALDPNMPLDRAMLYEAHMASHAYMSAYEDSTCMFCCYGPGRPSQPSNFLPESKPADLLASDVRQHIQAESKSRLRDAVENGVPLDALYFTDDCYPAWDSIYEMNPGRNHHARVQKRLLNREAAALADPMIMKKLVDAANGKLEEARLLGIALGDITIGRDLVPEWDPRVVDAAVPCIPEPVEDHWEDSLERNIETLGADFVLDNITRTDSVDSGQKSVATSDSDSSSGDDDNGGGNNQHGEPVDDRYAMLSGGDPRPLPLGYRSIAENDDEALHILHDVEAETDSNLDELPEVELAIDATAYEFFFPTDEAVDASLPGVDLECTVEDGDVVMEG
ncbi:hypothetical protein MKX08_003049 [Trichoderma sp. CBMAI-0020]|nr:hypothetical protein MKX08_003049 [Trichoderma sp. CBMAI-0020]